MDWLYTLSAITVIVGGIVGLTVASGVLPGILVTVSSIVAGAAAVLFFPNLKLSALPNLGGELAHAVPLTRIAGLGHWANGSFDGSLLARLLPGICLGSHASAGGPERFLRPLGPACWC